MKYRDELVREIREIREKFEKLYETCPLDASESLRKGILGIAWDERIRNSPREFRHVLLDLRTVSRKTEGIAYSSEQMSALCNALKLCEKYEISSREAFDSAGAIENAGIDGRLIFDDETIDALRDAVNKLLDGKQSPYS
jgi:hypothetical protein